MTYIMIYIFGLLSGFVLSCICASTKLNLDLDCSDNSEEVNIDEDNLH